MMGNRALMAIIIFVLLSFNSFGQSNSDYTGGVIKLIVWFDDIDKAISGISDKEKLKRIYRQLGYLNEDIDNIALEKHLLANELSNLTETSSQADSEEFQPNINAIIKDVNNLIGRLESVKGDVSQTDQVVVDKIIQTIRKDILSKKKKNLDDIKDYLYGKDIPIAKIKEDAIQAEKIAEEVSVKIKEAKSKIKQKLDNS